MTREFSAGGIVFKKLTPNDQPASPSQGGRLTTWLICQHSQHKGWVFPKGLIGDTNEKELKEETAVREVKEETGVDAKMVKDLPITVQYWYQFKGEKIFKTVYFFLMEEVGGDINKHDHEMIAVKWASEEEVKSTLTYQNDKKAFDEALQLFKELSL